MIGSGVSHDFDHSRPAPPTTETMSQAPSARLCPHVPTVPQSYKVGIPYSQVRHNSAPIYETKQRYPHGHGAGSDLSQRKPACMSYGNALNAPVRDTGDGLEQPVVA